MFKAVASESPRKKRAARKCDLSGVMKGGMFDTVWRRGKAGGGSF